MTPLKAVTPASKYLALILFVTLPFIGGWVGYTYAPEKITEIERVSITDEDYSKDTEMAKSIDFGRCEPQLESASWEGLELVVVLGESRFDKKCHTIIYNVSSFGDGGYMMRECWVPMSLGEISAETSDWEGKTTNPHIPSEFCTTTVKEGIFESS